MNTRDQEQAIVEQFKAEAESLVARAVAAGVVLTVTQKPLEPLKMGHYVTTVEARADLTGNAR